MRGIVGLYLGIGIVLLAIGFLLPGPCSDPNTGVVSNIVFVLTWPVGLYDRVYHGPLSARLWLRQQACAAGGPLGPKKTVPSEPAPRTPPASPSDGSGPVPIPPPGTARTGH
jgi:hypothetical protein